MVFKMSENLLEVKNITKIYSSGSIFRNRRVKAVDNISFSIKKEVPIITTLAGESGSGKSTIANLLLGLIPPTNGEIIYNGRNINKLKKEDLMKYRKEVQMIFQDPYAAYNPFYRSGHILTTPIRKFQLADNRKDESAMIREALESINLSPDIIQKYPHELSGGERQRIMIARALIMKPKIIIADEPVSMIDASLRAGILNLITDLNKNHGVSFIYVTHDLSTAYYLCDRILILYRGTIVEEGEVESVIKNPLHPYLKQLKSSIPSPDPDKRWKEKYTMRTEEITYKIGEVGCKYCERCHDFSEGRCEILTPQLIEVEPDHYVACHSIK